MNVELSSRPEAWDRYVETSQNGRLHHRWVWRQVITDTFGHQPHYLAAVDHGEIRGILPLFSVRSRLFGNSLVSVPFLSYGGVLADNDDAREKLLLAAVKHARQVGARHIELRQGEECPISWNRSASKVTMEIQLPSSADEFWKQLSSGMRNKIRTGQKHNLRAEWGGLESVPIFYKIFATNMRNLGTPVYSRQFFENQIRLLMGKARILTLWDDTTPVAASFLTADRDILELPWSASLLESRKKYSQVLMYWIFIQKAIEEGFKKIDLGRCSPGSGTYEFKRHWNPVERALHWYHWTPSGAEVPHLHADNPKYKLAVEIWKRLPLAITNGLGPRLVRSIP